MRTADVLVIGGGVAGIGAAAMLAGRARVILLETEPRTATHATARSAAISLPGYGGDAVREATALSMRWYLDPDLDLDAPLTTPRGLLTLAEAGDEALLGLDAGAEPIPLAEAARRVPILRSERFAAASFEPRARDVEVDLLVQGWTRRLRAGGGEIATGAEARALRREAGVWRVETPAGVFAAPVVVNAAGAWADRVAGRAGVAPLGLAPMRRSAAALPPPEGRDVRGWPLFGDARERWYARPLGARLMVSPAEEEPVDPHDAFADDMALAEGLHRYEQAVTVPVTRVETSWGGLRTFAPDRTPVLGFAPEAAGFFWLAGQGGYGVQTAPALSALAAALILDGAPPEGASALASALSPARFAAT